jgi:hypothetical protein
VLQKDEIMVPEIILDILELKVGDKVELQLDLFGIAGFDLSKLKRILFDYDTLGLEVSQGAYLLEYFEIDPELEFDPTDYFDDKFLHESIQKVSEMSHAQSFRVTL